VFGLRHSPSAHSLLQLQPDLTRSAPTLPATLLATLPDSVPEASHLAVGILDVPWRLSGAASRRRRSKWHVPDYACQTARSQEAAPRKLFQRRLSRACLRQRFQAPFKPNRREARVE